MSDTWSCEPVERDLAGGQRSSRPALAGDMDVDVAIVGAGYTGSLDRVLADGPIPSLRIVVCERESVGFGASGRNGGWCSALFAGSREATALDTDATAVVAMQRAMFATVDEIERVIADEGIDCDWARGGTIQVATLPAHRERLRDELDDHRSWGFGVDDYRELTPAPRRAR